MEFVDTNILLYAHDRTAGDKRSRSVSLLEELDGSGNGALSVQVLQEFVVTSTTRVKPPLASGEVVAILEDLSDWMIYSPGADDVIEAFQSCLRFKISFWDAMIVHAARQVEATVLWTEDLSDGQDYGGVVARNPFKPKE